MDGEAKRVRLVRWPSSANAPLYEGETTSLHIIGVASVRIDLDRDPILVCLNPDTPGNIEVTHESSAWMKVRGPD